MACSKVPLKGATEEQDRVDAALPFLSFLAGLMTAGEILKLSLPGYPFNANKVTMTTKPIPRLVPSRISQRTDCICGERVKSVHRRMIEGSKHAELSLEPVSAQCNS